MGHRKHSQPRRGSLAYLPHGRARSMEARIRTWINNDISNAPKILGHAGFKVGCLQIASVDDKEKTPNAGKQIIDIGTILATPPAVVVAARGYSDENKIYDVFASNLPKEIIKYVKPKKNGIKILENKLSKIKRLFVILAVIPSNVGLSQKKPYIFEVGINGNDMKEQLEFIKKNLGKSLKISDIFEAGTKIDVAAITKGKGWEGPITRWGVKRKQHKSRKSVREVGSLGPISPQNVMYTVPRAGQRGFHQRIEYNKRIMVVSNTTKNEFKINPKGGFKHFGFIDGDYIIIRGSVPGSIKRLIKLRTSIRSPQKKLIKPNVISIIR
ncbi:MAG: 50S ribosomal protein L3 [Thaumarchaeota archaeon]|nr:50S ribosomal protein L3 [Nitrososphaerota archaeon]